MPGRFYCRGATTIKKDNVTMRLAPVNYFKVLDQKKYKKIITNIVKFYVLWPRAVRK